MGSGVVHEQNALGAAVALPHLPQKNCSPPLSVHKSVHPGLLMRELWKGTGIRFTPEAQGDRVRPNDGHRHFLEGRGVRAQHEGHAVHVAHSLDPPGASPLAARDVGARGERPVENAHLLVSVVESAPPGSFLVHARSQQRRKRRQPGILPQLGHLWPQ